MIQIHTLSNGLRLIYEHLPYLRSASVGVFVKTGSMMESEEEAGLSHFIEHLAFKGTTKRSAKQLAEEIDLLGGHVNASTSRVVTSFYAKTMDSDLPRAIDFLADMMINPLFDPADIDKEREVVLEEIAMESDAPEDQVFNLIQRNLYHGQTLAHTILGSKENINSVSPAQIRAFKERFYQPGNTVIAVAGRFDPEALISWVEGAFSGWVGDQAIPYPKNEVIVPPKPALQSKDTEQAHLCLAYQSLPANHPDRYALMALSTVLGGGVSSRLFQKIREEQGLVYSIYSYQSSYPGCGDFSIYAACSPSKIAKVLQLIHHEVDDLLQNGISQQEFDQTLAQMKTGYALAMEGAYQRMAAMGINLLMFDRVLPSREVLGAMKKVKPRHIQKIADQILNAPSALAVVGKKLEKYVPKEMQ